MVLHAAKRRFVLAVSAAGLLHVLALILMGWMSGRGQADPSVPERPAALLTRWLTASPAPRLPVAEPPRAVPAATRAVPSIPTVTATQGEAPPTAGQEPRGAAPLPVPDEPALSADVVQRAVRESARQRGVATLANERLGGPPPTGQERLAAGVASGATTDCLKGGADGHRGQGLGLLNLPLLVVDAATGRCR